MTKRKVTRKMAYHEAGQIVMGYFAGFRIEQIDLTDEGMGTDYDYSSDQKMIEMIFHYTGESDLTTLSQGIKTKVTQVAYKICNVIFGGPISEVYLDLGIDFSGELPVKLVDPDLSGLKQVDYFMGALYPEEELDFLATNFKGVTEMIAMPLFWEAITVLGEAIAEKEKLSGSAIEIILADNRFFEGLQMLSEQQE